MATSTPVVEHKIDPRSQGQGGQRLEQFEGLEAEMIQTDPAETPISRTWRSFISGAGVCRQVVGSQPTPTVQATAVVDLLDVFTLPFRLLFVSP